MAEFDTSLFTQPVRIDSWVWAVRLIKTRSQSAAECKAGQVKLNGTAVKPSQQVVPGDIVTLWHEHRNIKVEVVATISKRVGAPLPAPATLTIPRRHRRRNSSCPCRAATGAPAGPQRRNGANSTDCGAAGKRVTGQWGVPPIHAHMAGRVYQLN